MIKEVRFNLESRKDKNGNKINENVPIRLSFFVADGRLEYYTQIRISQSHNFNREYYKTGKSPIKSNEPEAARKNKKLRELKAKAQLLYDNAIALDIPPTKIYIRDKLDEHFKGKHTRPAQLLVKDGFIEFLEYVKQKRSYRTWQKYNTTYNQLSSTIGKEINKLVFSDINTAFVEKFKKSIINQGYKEKGERREYLNNSLVKYLRSFREFLNWCKDEKRQYYLGNAKFEELKENEIDIIFLDTKQVKQVIDAEMPTTSLEQVKDVFLFGWYTGLRYQDIKNLKKINVRDEDIKFYISKGSHTTSHEVPLVKESKKILEKYRNINGDKALPVFSNSKMNKYIKIVMKNAGLNDRIPLKKLKADGTFEEKEFELWELITCHTSRKSFITHAVEMGMDEIDIKSITGHSKNSRAFTRYYEVSSEKKKNEMHKIFGDEIVPKLKAV